MKRAVHEAQAADLRLCVQDAADPTSWCSPPTCRCRATNLPTHVIFNKTDLATAQLPLASGLVQAVHPVSCSTGAGLPALTTALATAVAHLCQTNTQHGPTLARHRHRQHLDACVQALQRALVRPCLRAWHDVLMGCLADTRTRRMTVSCLRRSCATACTSWEPSQATWGWKRSWTWCFQTFASANK